MGRVSERTADIYMQRARKLIQQDSEIERPEWLAAAIARLVKYEQKAGKEDNLQSQSRPWRPRPSCCALTSDAIVDGLAVQEPLRPLLSL